MTAPDPVAAEAREWLTDQIVPLAGCIERLRGVVTVKEDARDYEVRRLVKQGARYRYLLRLVDADQKGGDT